MTYDEKLASLKKYLTDKGFASADKLGKPSLMKGQTFYFIGTLESMASSDHEVKLLTEMMDAALAIPEPPPSKPLDKSLKAKK
jgi:hypothetical protein